MRQEANTKMEKMERVEEVWTRDKKPEPPAEKSVDGSSNLQETIVFFCACVTFVVLSNAVISSQWMMPFIYVVLAPVLFGSRIVSFWRKKMMFLLVDFCYSVHVQIAVFLCLSTSLPPYLFVMIFGFANGPVLTSIVLFKDALVLHRMDKLTSIFLHIFPALLTFCVRWYPDEVSKYWFKELVPEVPQFSLVWLYVAPLTYITCYLTLNTLIVLVIIKPSAEYRTLYTAVCERGLADKFLNFCGKRGRYLMFVLLFVRNSASALILSIASFSFFEFHCCYLIYVIIVSTWWGAKYYRRDFADSAFPAEKNV